MVSVEAFSDLLQVLYSAPLQQEQWQQFLSLACTHTGSNMGVFISADTCSGLSILAAGGAWSEGAVVSRYNHEYAQNDPFRSALVRRCRTQNPVAVYTEDELVPSHDFLKTDLYCGLMAPANLRYGAITILACTVRKLDAISLWRTPEEGPADADARRLMELLIPHVQTALKVRRALGIAEQRQASTEAMANASPTATFVLTKEGRVQHWNTAAESLVRSNDVLTVADGNLSALLPGNRASLAKLLRDAVSPTYCLSKPSPCHALSLQRSHGRHPLQLLAVALPDAHRERSHADLLLLVSDSDKPASFPDDLLHALYGLTPAETEVANGLLMGYSPEEIGCLRRVSTSTIRQQLKSMLTKTGTNRQSDMVRLLMGLPRVPVLSS